MSHLLALVLAVSTLSVAWPSIVNELRPRHKVSSLIITYIGSSPGLLSTPNYPEHYNNNTDSLYTIQSGNSSSFTVNFYACECYLEDGYMDLCVYDYIQLGTNTSKLCGSQTDNNYTADSSDEGTVDVMFHSDYSFSYEGCLISYGIDATKAQLMSRCPQLEC